MSAEDIQQRRIVIEPAEEPVRVSINGTVVADTTRAVAVREESLPVRYYIPREDVRLELLEASPNTSHCPHKGDASYWSVDGAPNVAWTYETPIEGVEQIAGMICFYNDRVELEVGDRRSD